MPTAEMTLGPFFPREFAAGANDLTQLDGRPVAGEVIEITGKPFTAKLKEGAHIALCFVSNSKHSEPHFMKGMSRKFKVYTPEG